MVRIDCVTVGINCVQKACAQVMVKEFRFAKQLRHYRQVRLYFAGEGTLCALYINVLRRGANDSQPLLIGVRCVGLEPAPWSSCAASFRYFSHSNDLRRNPYAAFRRISSALPIVRKLRKPIDNCRCSIPCFPLLRPFPPTLVQRLPLSLIASKALKAHPTSRQTRQQVFGLSRVNPRDAMN